MSPSRNQTPFTTSVKLLGCASPLVLNSATDSRTPNPNNIQKRASLTVGLQVNTLSGWHPPCSLGPATVEMDFRISPDPVFQRASTVAGSHGRSRILRGSL